MSRKKSRNCCFLSRQVLGLGFRCRSVGTPPLIQHQQIDPSEAQSRAHREPSQRQFPPPNATLLNKKKAETHWDDMKKMRQKGLKTCYFGAVGGITVIRRKQAEATSQRPSTTSNTSNAAVLILHVQRGGLFVYYVLGNAAPWCSWLSLPWLLSPRSQTLFS